MPRANTYKFSVLVLIFGLMALACQREDTDFPIPPALRGFDFSLSNDSIVMDTLPTEYLSATYNIRIYNPKREAITLRRIKLLDGKQGFSINVDGSFGQDFKNIRIEQRDSIYLFARAFLPLGKEDEATEVKDLLEILDEQGRAFQIPILAVRQNVDHIKGLIIDKSQIRSSARPYLVHDSIVISEGGKLRLESPAQIWFANNAYMRVEGELEIEGQAENAVRFTGIRFDKFLPLVPYSRLTAQWGGVLFGKKSKASLSYFHLLNASFGLHFAPNKGARQGQAIELKHCKISNIKGAGINADIGSFKISDSEISNTLGSCLILSGGQYDIERSSMINYYPWPDIRSDEALIYQDKSLKGETEAQSSFLKMNLCVLDGAMPVYKNLSDNREFGGELKFNLNQEEGSSPRVQIRHSYLRSIQYPNNGYYLMEHILYRDRQTKAEDLYQYLGENKDKKKDYRFNFRPKASAPFVGLGTDGTAFLDLDGKPRHQKMTYGAYRSN